VYDRFSKQIAELHARYLRIHPFLDGNGPIGRLVLDLILVRLGYPPAIISRSNRPRYLRALRRADAGDPAELEELLARAVLDDLASRYRRSS
jgi:Fic family protein